MKAEDAMMTQPLQNKGTKESGQTLIAVLLLGGVLALLGFALMRMVAFEMKITRETKVKDRFFSAADGALHRSMAILTQGTTTGESWYDPNNMAGYRSLTFTGNDVSVTAGGTLTVAVPYKELPNVQYWVKILKGDRLPPPVTATAYLQSITTDTGVDLWENVGDLNLDRTIVVRVLDSRGSTIGAKEDIFYTVVHRNDAKYYPGGKGIEAAGTIDLGQSWSGDAYNSCNGPYNATTNSSANGSYPNPGTVQSGTGITNGSDDFGLTKVTGPINPPPPPSINYLNAETNVVGSASSCIGGSLTTPDIDTDARIGGDTPSAGMPGLIGGGALVVDEWDVGGNDVVTIDVSRGFVHIYVCGDTIDIGGNTGIDVVAPTANLLIDDFSNVAQYNSTHMNDLGQHTTLTAGTVAKIEPTGFALSISATSSAYTWYSNLACVTCSSTATRDMRGYRYLEFSAKGIGTAPTFDVYFQYLSSAAGTTQYYASLNSISVTAISTTGMTTVQIPIPVTVNMQYMRRIFFTNFQGGSPVAFGLDDIYFKRYCGTDCCQTGDAVVYVMTNNTVTLHGGTNYEGLIYAPESHVQVSGGGNGNFSGAIVAKSFDTSGGGSGWFHYDDCLSKNAQDVYAAPPILQTQWRQIGRKN